MKNNRVEEVIRTKEKSKEQQMDSIERLWKRIEAWLASHAPAVLNKLQPGASAQAIRQAEQALGMALPEEVRASYRIHTYRIHNGSSGFELTTHGKVLSLEEIVESNTWKPHPVDD